MWYPFVQQEQTNDCAYACLAMLVNYYHHRNLSISEIKTTNQLNSNGDVSIYELVKLAQNYQITLSPYQVTKTEFLKIKTFSPMVVYLLTKEGQGHFVILYQKKRHHYLIANPGAQSLQWMPEDDFLGAFQHVAIFTKKNENLKFKNKSFANIFYFLKPYWKTSLMLIIIGMFVNFVLILNKSFIKIYLDQLHKLIHHEIILLFLVFTLIILLKSFLNFCWQKLLLKFQFRITHDVVASFMNNLNSLSLTEYEKFDHSDWLKRMEDLALLANFIGTTMLTALIRTIMMVMSFILLLTISNVILLIVILETIFNFLLALIFWQINKIIYYRWYEKSLSYQSQVLQYFTSFISRKSRNLTAHFYYQWNKEYQDLLQATYQLEKDSYHQQSALNIFSQLLNLVIFYLAVNLITTQHLSIGDLMFYSALALYFNDFSNLFANLIANKSHFVNAYQRVEWLLFKNCESAPAPNNLPTKIKEITINNLTYEINGINLFKNLSLTFQHHIFLKGTSGVGKTTLLAILGRLKENYQGEILINKQVNLATVDEAEWRAKVMILHQQDYLFANSVYDNIINFNPNADIAILRNPVIQTILQTNQIDLTRMLVNNGDNLSKGQRQIILFLNLLCQRKEVYFIDESLSNVDEKTKLALVNLLLTSKQDSLIIYCGHDPKIEQSFSQVIDLSAEVQRNNV
ncbi:cysteine peptidase family C39 domain-containing protein [Spiroplasma eriocheiris]|uniref:Bacteriocin ABC transporter n=1 Tax=Spiroplasma eriocheiris TaxID=315358 RepID=A0A0H3XHV1_9MOLU|nr:cysteine peptidase family C39 domain-containing protein [Spiroplasma eriocheiris]AHF57931.1 ABC-type bacteriocin transport system permease and ATP-binding protein [Spiroplasma eriocheiris CCTCC M 207170]AKM54373.1 bacteriocin ABC transporter [Spiroplasma eriocheiris]